MAVWPVLLPAGRCQRRRPCSRGGLVSQGLCRIVDFASSSACHDTIDRRKHGVMVIDSRPTARRTIPATSLARSTSRTAVRQDDRQAAGRQGRRC
ncbi:MAG: hypothetical protein MZV65_29270 [Chromatiales bacterium]|nr:hypothetical protein [Chromatiales bacterium]